MPDPLLKVRHLGVSFRTPSTQSGQPPIRAVDDVSFDLEAGKILALVGESGSGKSVSALSVTQLLPYPLAVHDPESSILFEGRELIGLGERDMRAIRGRRIGMIFQEPQTALNPLHTIARQIGESLEIHQGLSRAKAGVRIGELMDLVGLSNLKDRLDAYPHELSGGQRQRVMIAMALANNPALLIADEPTTALDVTVQAQILDLLNDLRTRLGMALLLITHDLSIVEKMADHVCVMQNGKIVESAPTQALFTAPEHPYTRMLLNARPPESPPERGKNTNPDTPLLTTAALQVSFPKQKNVFGKPKTWVHAVDGVDLQVQAGHTLGIVGESGSGKSTLGLAILRLIQSTGDIVYLGQNIAQLGRKEMLPLRQDIQIVFQDPYGSLSPRLSVNRIVGEGLDVHRRDLSPAEREDLVISALRAVHMDPETRHRYPHEFSGGQRQRLSIARALVLRPRLLILDEPTSALDVSIQAEVVNLLRELQRLHGLAYLFISHDLRVVRALAHDLIVMKDGKIVESGETTTIFQNPKDPYTKALIEAALNIRTAHISDKIA